MKKGANYEKIMSAIPKDSEKVYKRSIKNYCDVGENFMQNRFYYTPEKLATKIFAIVETKKPKAKYNMAPDAKIIGSFFSNFMPFSWRSRYIKKMFFK